MATGFEINNDTSVASRLDQMGITAGDDFISSVEDGFKIFYLQPDDIRRCLNNFHNNLMKLVLIADARAYFEDYSSISSDLRWVPQAKTMLERVGRIEPKKRGYEKMHLLGLESVALQRESYQDMKQSRLYAPEATCSLLLMPHLVAFEKVTVGRSLQRA